MLESHLGNEYGTGVFHYQHSMAANIPDALYMVDDETRAAAAAAAADGEGSGAEEDVPGERRTRGWSELGRVPSDVS